MTEDCPPPGPRPDPMPVPVRRVPSPPPTPRRVQRPRPRPTSGDRLRAMTHGDEIDQETTIAAIADIVAHDRALLDRLSDESSCTQTSHSPVVTPAGVSTGTTFESALTQFVHSLREYAADWTASPRLQQATNHRDNAGLVQAVTEIDADELRVRICRAIGYHSSTTTGR